MSIFLGTPIVPHFIGAIPLRMLLENSNAAASGLPRAMNCIADHLARHHLARDSSIRDNTCIWTS